MPHIYEYGYVFIKIALIKKNISFQKEMIPWISAASLMYGMVALFLALIIGGYTPLTVIESGGWGKFLKFSRSPRSATQRRIARQNYASSPHGQISVLAHQRWQQGHSIISTHGGLILLAVPFQVLLATLPLAMVLMVPDSVMRENRRLELALILYIFTLGIVMKYYPRVAKRYIGIASFTRKWLISMTKISWLAPVLILWLMGRMASVVVLGWIGTDIDLNIDFEKSFFETTLNIGSIPETSFLDLIAALAVIPLATFTTLAVLGAGSGDPPEWMVENLELHQSKESNLSDTVDNLSNAIVNPEVSEVIGRFTSTSDYTNDIEEEEMSDVLEDDGIEPQEDYSPNNEDAEPNEELGFEHFFDDNFGQTDKQPNHDEPSVRGLK